MSKSAMHDPSTLPEHARATQQSRIVTVSESGLGSGQIVIAGRHVLGSDEPETVGGRDTGPDPYEYVMAGLGSCTAMTIRLYANRKARPLVKVSVTVRHRIEGSDGALIDVFDLDIALDGGLSAEQRQKLVEIAAKCPVSRTLSRASRVSEQEV